MLRCPLFTLLLLLAPLGTMQRPQLRGSKQAAEVPPTSDDKAFLFAQTDVHIKTHKDNDTCDASRILTALARPETVKMDDADDAITDFENPERLEQALAAELDNSLADNRSGIMFLRTQKLETELRGLFKTLPKNEHGGLGHAAVNYAVRQHFLRRHQWYLRNDETNEDLPSGEVLRARVPQQLQFLLERRRGQFGLSHRDLAALVATIEHLLDDDLKARVKAAYSARSLTIEANSSVPANEAYEALLTFASNMISLKDRSGFGLKGEEARKDRLFNEHTYPGWTRISIRVSEMVNIKATRTGEISLDEAVHIAREVSTLLGQLLRSSCFKTKTYFEALPQGSSGRVAVSDMHKAASKHPLEFSETTSFLKSHRMLDESDAANPKVIVPNLIYGPSNCVGETSFLEVCCPNECESIIQHIENVIGHPSGTPKDISSLVLAAFGPRLVHSNSPPIMTLDEVADDEGLIALHGRAFAEWLNRAFPLECPMPHAEEYVGMHGQELQNTVREFHVVDPSIQVKVNRTNRTDVTKSRLSSIDVKPNLVVPFFGSPLR